MTKRARKPAPLPSFVHVAAMLVTSAQPPADVDRPSIVVVCRVDGHDVTDADAVLTIDGAPVPADGKPIALEAGEHEVVMEIPGDRHAERILVAQGQHSRVIVMELRRRPPEILGGVPPRVERGGCCGGTGAAMAARDVRGMSAFMVLAAVLAARRRRDRDDREE